MISPWLIMIVGLSVVLYMHFYKGGIETYNCARVHVGTYMVDPLGSHSIHCRYFVERGRIFLKRLRPITVHGTNHERTITRLQTLVIYPVTDEAIIEITNSKGVRRLKLIKYRKSRGRRSTMFKARM